MKSRVGKNALKYTMVEGRRGGGEFVMRSYLLITSLDFESYHRQECRVQELCICIFTS